MWQGTRVHTSARRLALLDGFTNGVGVPALGRGRLERHAHPTEFAGLAFTGTEVLGLQCAFHLIPSAPIDVLRAAAVSPNAQEPPRWSTTASRRRELKRKRPANPF